MPIITNSGQEVHSWIKQYENLAVVSFKSNFPQQKNDDSPFWNKYPHWELEEMC